MPVQPLDKIRKKTIQDKQPDSIIQNLPSTSQFILPLNEHKSPTKKDVSTNSEGNNSHIIKTSPLNSYGALGENKEEGGDHTKLEAHIPKIVNVIPKIAESKSKTDISLVTTQVNEADYKAVKSETIASKPIAVDDLKQSADSKEPIIKDSQEVKPQIKYVFPTIQNSYEISNTSKSNGTETVVQESKESKHVQIHSKHNDDTITQLNKTSSTSNKQDKNLESSSHKPPTAVEEDFEEFDSNTLKPIKEWECHLCTLLNPIASNVCAVCATVRLLKNQDQTIKKQVKKKDRETKLGNAVRSDETYLQLINLDSEDLVKNVDQFECLVCFLDIAPQEGITLRECLHQFCKPCLSQTIEFAEEAEIKCPYRDEEYSCNIALQDREVKALVSANVYEAHLAKSVAQAENRTDKSFHCKTPDCKGWCIFEDNVNDFPCPVCRKTNCLTCQAIHTGMNCKQYQEKMKDESEIDDDARRTKNMLDEMVNKGEAIECPSCKIILMKKWGCDWLRCSMCKTEICWVTRGPRWGPAGKGDTSGGCQCGVNGVKCHPKCNYCH